MYETGSSVWWTSRWNCPRKGLDKPSWLIHVLLAGLRVPLLSLLWSSSRWEKSLLNLLGGILFACAPWSILTFIRFSPDCLLDIFL